MGKLRGLRRTTHQASPGGGVFPSVPLSMRRTSGTPNKKKNSWHSRPVCPIQSVLPSLPGAWRNSNPPLAHHLPFATRAARSIQRYCWDYTLAHPAIQFRWDGSLYLRNSTMKTPGDDDLDLPSVLQPKITPKKECNKSFGKDDRTEQDEESLNPIASLSPWLQNWANQENNAQKNMETNSRNIVGLSRTKVEGASCRNFRRTCDDRNWPARDPTLVFLTSYFETIFSSKIVVNECKWHWKGNKMSWMPSSKTCSRIQSSTVMKNGKDNCSCLVRSWMLTVNVTEGLRPVYPSGCQASTTAVSFKLLTSLMS